MLCCFGAINSRVSFMRMCECRRPAFFSKVRILHIFPHKLAFTTAILILFVFLLPISIRFRYLDHLVANRMAPSVCPDPCGTRWVGWFHAIMHHISAYFGRIFGVYAVRIFFKCRVKLTCLKRNWTSTTGRSTNTSAPIRTHAQTDKSKT